MHTTLYNGSSTLDLYLKDFKKNEGKKQIIHIDSNWGKKEQVSYN